MYTYLLITMAVIIPPLLLSFDRKVHFHTHWPYLFLSLLPVSALYIIWDVLVTIRGHWSFNPEYSGIITLFHLPLGEWLFFLVVPYATIFIYEVLSGYFPVRTIISERNITILLITPAVLCIALALLAGLPEYTTLALISFSLMLITANFTQKKVFRESHTLGFLILSFVAFFLVNGILTGLPVVLYSPEHILGVRVFSIPVEDFLYNLSLLGFYLISYATLKEAVLKRRSL
ncbi:MAG: lycopene cyclase domain-containing protein [Sphaerochaetaceae bacterium]|nr:lycopene cyclase domain-containing protein [Sphaerochaetaceae bacterium]